MNVMQDCFSSGYFYSVLLDIIWHTSQITLFLIARCSHRMVVWYLCLLHLELVLSWDGF